MDTKNYTLMTANDDGSATLGIIRTLKVAVDRGYDIKPSTRWGGGKRCKVISVHADHARCIVGKIQGRGYYATGAWFPSEYDIPFSAFLEEWF